MNIRSRESLLRDGAFDAPRRDSFIRDEFAGLSRPPHGAGRDKGLDEFASESDWDGPRQGGIRLLRAEVALGIVVIALVVGGVSTWTLISGRADPPPTVVESAASVQPPAAEPVGREATPVPPARKAVPPHPPSRLTAANAPSGTQTARPPSSPVAREAGRPATASPPQANILTPTLLADTQLETPAIGTLRGEAPRNIDAGGLNRVYTSADREVIPPKMIVEDVPGALIVGMPRRMQSVELMVTEAGDVSRVRLLTEQRRILDTMLLSRAKMWRFTPALRQGRPVPYRLVVLWEVND